MTVAGTDAYPEAVVREGAGELTLAFPGAVIREGADELALRAEEVGALRTFIDMIH